MKKNIYILLFFHFLVFCHAEPYDIDTLVDDIFTGNVKIQIPQIYEFIKKEPDNPIFWYLLSNNSFSKTTNKQEVLFSFNAALKAFEGFQKMDTNNTLISNYPDVSRSKESKLSWIYNLTIELLIDLKFELAAIDLENQKQHLDDIIMYAQLFDKSPHPYFASSLNITWIYLKYRHKEEYYSSWGFNNIDDLYAKVKNDIRREIEYLEQNRDRLVKWMGEDRFENEKKKIYHLNMGLCHGFQNNFPRAIEHYLQYEFVTQEGERYYHTNLYDYYFLNFEFDKALEVIDDYIPIQDKYDFITNYDERLSKAIIYFNKKDFQSANAEIKAVTNIKSRADKNLYNTILFYNTGDIQNAEFFSDLTLSKKTIETSSEREGVWEEKIYFYRSCLFEAKKNMYAFFNNDFTSNITGLWDTIVNMFYENYYDYLSKINYSKTITNILYDYYYLNSDDYWSIYFFADKTNYLDLNFLEKKIKTAQVLENRVQANKYYNFIFACIERSRGDYAKALEYLGDILYNQKITPHDLFLITSVGIVGSRLMSEISPLEIETIIDSQYAEITYNILKVLFGNIVYFSHPQMIPMKNIIVHFNLNEKNFLEGSKANGLLIEADLFLKELKRANIIIEPDNKEAIILDIEPLKIISNVYGTIQFKYTARLPDSDVYDYTNLIPDNVISFESIYNRSDKTIYKKMVEKLFKIKEENIYTEYSVHKEDIDE